MIKQTIGMLFFCIAFCNMVKAVSISGRVTEKGKGQPLAFVSVYLKGTTKGTTTNIDGYYTLDLPKGEQVLVFRYVGYKEETQTIQVGDKPLHIDIALEEISQEMQEVVITTGGEDPAYRIIRQAQAKRKFYLNQLDRFACDVYIKGNQRLNGAPDKFMGEKIGNMDGILDTARSGILYLSESVSRYSYEKGKYHEEMKYSKVSGDDNGFSFNNAQSLNFNFYENQMEFGRQIISPIADGAMTFYEYKLEGAYVDASGNLINKIKVTPKHKYDPAYRGHIFIAENSWRISGAELMVTEEASKIPVIDSVIFRQVYVPVSGDVWMPFNQNIGFQGALLGFKFRGDFTAVFSSYDITPAFQKHTFTSEVLKVNPLANKQTKVFWDSIRPIPLTLPEARDYTKKDSLHRLWTTKRWMDSVDRQSNVFKVMDVLLGYTLTNSFRRTYLIFDPILNTVQFNSVQGWNGQFRFRYRKEEGEGRHRWWEIGPTIQYGFSDHAVRGQLAFDYHFSDVTHSTMGISGGRMAVQFNADNPIGNMVNSLYSLYVHDNHMKLYDKYFAKVSYEQEVVNGLYLNTGLEYDYRVALVNHTNYSIFNKDRQYMTNTPNDWDYSVLTQPVFASHDAFIFTANLKWRPGQKYLSYPGRKIIQPSNLPSFALHYRTGMPGGEVRYHHLSLQMEYELKMALVGNSYFNIEGGMFLQNTHTEFPDWQHFNGNQTIFARNGKYLNTFQVLPYYWASTNGPWFTMHYEHHFKGFILNKIPVIRALGWAEVVGAHVLVTNTYKPYTEFNVGLDNVGFKALKLFRIDYAFNILPGWYSQRRIVIAFKLAGNRSVAL